MSLRLSLKPIEQDQPRRGIILMLFGIFFGAISIVLIKYLGERYPTSQITFLRNALAIPMMTLMVLSAGGVQSLKTNRFFHHVLRALTGTASMLLLFFSLHFLPLADASAISFSGPLFVGLFSMLLLKEKVSRQRWTAIFLGFIGVMFIAQPGHDGVPLNGVFMGVGSAIFYGLSMLGLRLLGKTESATTTVFYFSVLSTFLTLPLAYGVWNANWLDDFPIFLSVGVLASCSQICTTRAFQYADASFVSPFGYTGILWATLFGFIFWGTTPNSMVWIGTAIIVGSGFFLSQTAGKPFSFFGLFHKAKPAQVPPIP